MASVRNAIQSMTFRTFSMSGDKLFPMNDMTIHFKNDQKYTSKLNLPVFKTSDTISARRAEIAP